MCVCEFVYADVDVEVCVHVLIYGCRCVTPSLFFYSTVFFFPRYFILFQDKIIYYLTSSDNKLEQVESSREGVASTYSTLCSTKDGVWERAVLMSVFFSYFCLHTGQGGDYVVH